MSSSPSSREILSRVLSLCPVRLDGPVPPRGSDRALDREIEPESNIKEENGGGSWPTSTFRKIGFGQCGLVFTVPDQPGMVVKIARPHFGESLYADFMAHQRVEVVFGRRSDELARDGVQLPQVFYFLVHPNFAPSSTNASVIGGDVAVGKTVLLTEKFQPSSQGKFPPPSSPKEWWNSHLPLFPPLYSTNSRTSSSQGLGQDASASQYSKFQLPAEALFTEHIPPLSAPIREALIDLYCSPASKQASVRADPANRDCLLRVYLGRRRQIDEKTGKPRVLTNFALRNYNLHLDQMLELGLDVHLLAMMMGTTLADVHWGAGVDAFDVEFVLGGARRATTTQGNGGKAERVADMWLLDFNLCSRFEVEQLAGETERLDGLVEHLVYAFFANDPYYPRPWTHGGKERGCEDGDILLWETFAKAYVDQGDIILRSRTREMYGASKDLPGRFIQGCVEKQKTLPPGVDKIGVD